MMQHKAPCGLSNTTGLLFFFGQTLYPGGHTHTHTLNTSLSPLSDDSARGAMNHQLENLPAG